MSIEVYNLLNEQTYQINVILCEYWEIYTQLTIIFEKNEDLEQFKKITYEQLNLNIRTELEILNEKKQVNHTNDNNIYNNELLNKRIKLKININDLTKFPEYTYGLLIINYSNNESILKNLPKKTKFLHIQSHEPCDLSNLPLGLIQLKLEDCKYNLDYLPSSLKILKIIFTDKKINPKRYYNIDDFRNLPIGLEHIEICKKVFNSIDDLIKNYDSTIFEHYN